MKKFAIKCNEANCKNHSTDGYCNAACEAIDMGDDGYCTSFDPIHVCRDCKKFKTAECRFIVTGDDAVCDYCMDAVEEEDGAPAVCYTPAVCEGTLEEEPVRKPETFNYRDYLTAIEENKELTEQLRDCEKLADILAEVVASCLGAILNEEYDVEGLIRAYTGKYKRGAEENEQDAGKDGTDTDGGRRADSHYQLDKLYG